MQSPKISVILPVYNGEKYLREAIESILNQTFSDFEFIILNDGSKDNSKDIILSYKDKRIKYFEHDNMGLAATLNRGIEISMGEFIARQDQDDISQSKRFEEQIKFMEENPDCAIVGCKSVIIHENRITKRILVSPAESFILKYDLAYYNPFVHSSIMMRKSMLSDVCYYSTDALKQPPEDYELWLRIAKQANIYNIPKVLHYYREVPGSMIRAAKNKYISQITGMVSGYINFLIGEQDNNLIKAFVALNQWTKIKIKPYPEFKDLSGLCFKLADAVQVSNEFEREVLLKRAAFFAKQIKKKYIFFKYFGFLSYFVPYLINIRNKIK